MTAASAHTALDPVTFAVMRNGLIAVTAKASMSFRRTALMPVLYEGSTSRSPSTTTA